MASCTARRSADATPYMSDKERFVIKSLDLLCVYINSAHMFNTRKRSILSQKWALCSFAFWGFDDQRHELIKSKTSPSIMIGSIQSLYFKVPLQIYLCLL